MAQPVEIEIKAKGISELKQELRSLKSELANATDPADIERLSMAAGQLSDKLTDVNEKVAVFAAGSDFEKVSNGLGLIGNQLASLDFEGASESANLLTATIKDMNPKAVADGFKSFIGTIGQLGNAFVQMGIKLLANPLFLLVAVIGGVVAAIVMLKDKLKIAEQAFNMLTMPLNVVIGLLKDLTDWMGLTAFAAEESADRQVKANNKAADSTKESTDAKVAQLDREIKMAKAAGKDVTELEIKKQETLIQGSKNLLSLARSTYAELDKIRKDGKTKLTDEQMKEFENAAKTIKAEKENILNAETEKVSIKIAKETEAQANADKAAKEAAEKRKAQYEKEKQELQRQKDALRNIENKYTNEIANLNAKTEEERLAIQRERDQKELDSIKLSTVAKKNAQKLLDEKYKIQSEQIEQARVDKLKEITETYNREILLINDKSTQAKLKQEEDAALAEIDKITQNETAKEEAKKAVREKYALLKREADAADFAEENNKELAKTEEDTMKFDQRYAIIAEREQLLKENTTLNEEERTAIEKANTDARIAIAQAELAAKTATLGAIGDALQGFTNLVGEQTAAGKAMAIAQATISAYTGIANVWGAPSPYPEPYGTAVKVASTVAVATSAFANIKKIISTKVPGKNAGGGAVGGTGAAAAANQPAQPTFGLFGGANRGNEATASKSVEATQPNQTITVRAVVSETEVTETQNRVQRIQQNAEL